MNRSLRILIGVNTVMVFTIGMFAPFYAVFVQKIGGDIVFAGFSWAVFSIVAGVLTLLFSRFEIKVKERELLLAFGYIVRGAVFLSYAFMTTIPQLLLTQVLWGIAVAIGVPAFDAIYSDHTTDGESLTEWGRWEGIRAIAVGCAALLGGVLINMLGFQAVFLIMSAFSLLLAAHIWTLPRELL